MNAMICSCKEVIDWWRVDLRQRVQRIEGKQQSLWVRTKELKSVDISNQLLSLVNGSISWTASGDLTRTEFNDRITNQWKNLRDINNGIIKNTHWIIHHN